LKETLCEVFERTTHFNMISRTRLLSYHGSVKLDRRSCMILQAITSCKVYL